MDTRMNQRQPHNSRHNSEQYSTGLFNRLNKTSVLVTRVSAYPEFKFTLTNIRLLLKILISRNSQPWQQIAQNP